MDKMVKKKDILLGVGIVIAALILFLVMRITGGSDGSQIRITVDGVEYGVYSLDEDREISVQLEDGINRVCTYSGEAYMEEADCPDGYCMNQGKISKVGETIVCLPHKVVVEVINAEVSQEEDAVDTVAQ